MGTRKSRHNKGRKPRYKEHRDCGASSDELNALAVIDAALRAHAVTAARKSQDADEEKKPL